jgi:hypothetical protein
MECWYSAFNAQGSRLIIVVVRLGAVKIYVAAVEALRKNERQDETQFTTKIDGFLSFIPRWMLMYFFAGLCWISRCVWPNSGFWCCVFLTLRITLLYGCQMLKDCFSCFQSEVLVLASLLIPYATTITLCTSCPNQELWIKYWIT